MWTNPSPTADFNTQTVTLSDSISSYDYIDIECRWSSAGGTSRHVYYTVTDFKAGGNGVNNEIYASVLEMHSRGQYIGTRYITYVSETQVKITASLAVQTSGMNLSSAMVLSIAGIKGDLPPVSSVYLVDTRTITDYLKSGSQSYTIDVSRFAGITTSNIIVECTSISGSGNANNQSLSISKTILNNVLTITVDGTCASSSSSSPYLTCNNIKTYVVIGSISGLS